MDSYVKEVWDLWKLPAEFKSKVKPYKVSDKFRTLAALFAPGEFYYYVLDLPNLKLDYVHEGIKDFFDKSPEEITFGDMISAISSDHKEPMAQKQKVLIDFFQNHVEPEEICSYKSVFFFESLDRNGRYRKLLHQSTVLSLTENNLPQHVLIVNTDVSHLNFIDKNSISFLSLTGKKSYLEINASLGEFKVPSEDSTVIKVRDLLSNRETEIVKLLAKGLSGEAISTQLNISLHTLHTHRKNILAKTNCQNSTEVVARSLVEGLIV